MGSLGIGTLKGMSIILYVGGVCLRTHAFFLSAMDW